MRFLAALLLFLPAGLSAWDGTAAGLASELRAAGLDRDECYRVRDLHFSKEDVRFFLTDGYIIFGKPVNGRRHSAVFVPDAGTGDAEILVFPPSRSERLSVARATGSPNLNEHFRLGVMVFTDDTYETLLKQIREAGEPGKSPERGMLMDHDWAPVVRNLTSSFEVRVIRDLLSSWGPSSGFFYMAVSSDRLGNFDVVYDPQAREQIVIGRVALRDAAAYFDTWTSFEALSFRKGSRSVRPEEYRLSDYRLDAVLQPDLNLKVTTKVTLAPSRDDTKVLELCLSPQMRLTAASIDGRPAEFFQRDAMRENLVRGGTGVFLLLPGSTLERGKPYELEFQHEGAVIRSAGNKVYFVGSRLNWYPNGFTQFAKYDARFRYPAGLNLVVAGEVVEQATEGAWNITRRRISTPVRFLGFNLGDYEQVSLTRGPFRVEVFANKQAEPGLQGAPRPVFAAQPNLPPGRTIPGLPLAVYSLPERPNPAARLQLLASEVAGAFEFMASKFGPPPLRNLTVSPIPASFGQGFPGLVYLSTLSYLRPVERPISARSGFEQAFFSEILQAHEVAHQWWGNVVAEAADRDNWLMEALANYSALLYIEKRRGVKALDSVLAEYKNHLLETAAEGRTVESTGPIVWGLRLRSSQAPDAWRTITYEKGSWIVHMLRRRLGDERFFAMLAELAKRYGRAMLRTEQFRELAVKFLPPGSPDPSLESFFDSYVYSTGIPALKMDYKVRGKAPSIQVSGTVSQSEVGEDFVAWVPIEIQFRAGRPLTRWIRAEHDPVSFSIALKQPPLKVVLDPSGSVLAVRK